MKYLLIFPYYLGWHYGRGTVETIIVFKDFLFFVPRFFSIGTLLKTLFSPFQRLKEHYEGGLELGALAEVLIVNLIMRLLGFFVRSFVIILGILSFLLTIVLEIFLFVVYLVLPLILAFFFVSSLIAIFNI